MPTLYLKNRTGDTIIELRGLRPSVHFEHELKPRGYTKISKREFVQLQRAIRAKEQDAPEPPRPQVRRIPGGVVLDPEAD